MNIVILGDKFQKRMKSKGCVGLFKHNNEYLIVKQYRVFKRFFPDCKIIYVYGFEHKKLLSVLSQYPNIIKDIELVYNIEYEQYNYGSSLRLVSNYLSDNTILLFGDTIIDTNTLTRININDAYSQIVINDNKANKLGCVINNSKIENIFYDLNNKIEEIYFLAQKDARLLQEILNKPSQNIKNMFVFELINNLIDRNVIIKPLHTNIKNYTKKKTKYVT
jgi:choline kinase